MELPKRKRIRLQEYDYSQVGVYFVTICAHEKKHIFGAVGAIHESPEPICHLSSCGEILYSAIMGLEQRFPNIKIDNFVVMPNHVHLMIQLLEKEGDGQRAHRDTPLQGRSELSKVVGYLKMNVSKKIHEIQPDLQVWQRSFHDHIIRNQTAYLEIWQYIDENQQKWQEDCYYMP